MKRLAIQVQYDDNFEQVMKSVGKSGYKYVSLGFGSSKCFHHSDWEKNLARIDTVLSENSLECIQTHLPYYDLMLSAEISDPDMDRAMLRCIEASGKLGAEWCAYHMRTAINDNFSPRKSAEYAKAAIEPLANAAREHKTGVALENLPIFPGIYQYKFFSSDYEDICEINDYFNCKEIGICWDFGHAHMMKYDEVKAIRRVGNRIKATHIHNNSQGTIDWPGVMGAMKDVYNGALTLEVAYNCNEYLDSFMAHSYDCLKYLEGLIEK